MNHLNTRIIEDVVDEPTLQTVEINDIADLDVIMKEHYSEMLYADYKKIRNQIRTMGHATIFNNGSISIVRLMTHERMNWMVNA